MENSLPARPGSKSMELNNMLACYSINIPVLIFSIGTVQSPYYLPRFLKQAFIFQRLFMQKH